MDNENAPPAGLAPGVAEPATPNGSTETFRRLVGKAALPKANPGSASGPSPVNKGGRATAAEEARRWAANNGFRLVPDSEAGAASGNGAGGALPGYVPDPAFVSRMAKTLLEGLDKWIQRSVFARVCRITRKVTGAPDEKEAREIAAEAAAPPGVVEVMAQCVSECTQKYDFLGQWTPEATLAIAASTWGLAVHGVFNRLDALELKFASPPAAPAPGHAKTP